MLALAAAYAMAPCNRRRPADPGRDDRQALPRLVPDLAMEEKQRQQPKFGLYFEGHGHWSDCWISFMRACSLLAFCAMA